MQASGKTCNRDRDALEGRPPVVGSCAPGTDVPVAKVVVSTRAKSPALRGESASNGPAPSRPAFGWA